MKVTDLIILAPGAFNLRPGPPAQSLRRAARAGSPRLGVARRWHFSPQLAGDLTEKKSIPVWVDTASSDPVGENESVRVPFKFGTS